MTTSAGALLPYNIPKEVLFAVETLENGGFEAFLVGGCVRDMIIGRKPSDWDIATNAKPEEIEPLFEKTFYENDYGTVGVVFEDTKEETTRVIEITPYRKEGAYSDFRRPDTVSFGNSLEEDLDRRDFTINAIAYNPSKGQIVDPHGGIKDIKDKTVRAVGNPEDRFSEDALRLMRAVRIATELGFSIDNVSRETILESSQNLGKIATERIRVEFEKIIMSIHPRRGIESLRELGLLAYAIPELEGAFGVEQGGAHAYDVGEHLLRSLQAAADKKWPLEVRLAALLHDIGKPGTRGAGKHKEYSFYGHEVAGARMARDILGRLKFPRETIDTVRTLVRWHMFFSDTEQITHSAVRRMIRNVGQENIQNLMNLRICDRVGTGRPKEKPYRFRKYQAMIDEVLRDPVSVGMLATDGARVMDVTHETPGPRIGAILHALLEEVLDDPQKNIADYLEKRAEELSALSDEQLTTLGEKGKERRDELEEEIIKDIRKGHSVA